MEALILDSAYETLAVLDKFVSFIWTVRFREYGDFEITMPIEASAIPYLKRDNYLMTSKSDRYMIIEDLEIKSDVELGLELVITGRSLESILERRVIWGQIILSGNLQNEIERLLNENFINPTTTSRKIQNFRFQRSSDPQITSLEVDTQFVGDNVYDIIATLCVDKNIGFRILPEGPGGFCFELYQGTNRSYNQDVNPWVTFSPSFENLFSSNYFESGRDYKTVAITAGEGEGTDQKIEEVIAVDAMGLGRRELFVDAGGISSSTTDGKLTESEYLRQLREKGSEALAEKATTKAFEGEVDAHKQFVYGKDFTIGDIVQVINELGMESESQITELILSHDATGEKTYPTFTAIKNDERG